MFKCFLLLDFVVLDLSTLFFSANMEHNLGREWELEIDELHPSLNVWTRMHWTKLSALKKEIAWTILAACNKAKLPKSIGNPVEIYIEYFHPRETADLDNLVPKLWLDCLKSHFGDDNITRLKKLGWTIIKAPKKKSIIYIKEII